MSNVLYRVHEPSGLVIASDGRVFGPNGQRKLRFCRSGYCRVNAKCGESIETFVVHKMVADCFIGPRKQGMTVNHKNGVKTDNRVENLEIVTGNENTAHAFRAGLVGTCAPIGRYYSHREAERVTGVSRKNKAALLYAVSMQN